VVVEMVRRETKQPNWGYDALRDEYCDVLSRGIIDPAKVARAAVENAASTAAMILTTETLVTEIPEKEAAGAHEHDHHHESAHGLIWEGGGQTAAPFLFARQARRACMAWGASGEREE